MIDDRQQEIDTMYADADAAKQKAADLEKEYADHLQSIKNERDAMLREATARAQKREEEIVGEARAEAASIRAAAEADIAQERKKAVNDLKTRSAVWLSKLPVRSWSARSTSLTIRP